MWQKDILDEYEKAKGTTSNKEEKGARLLCISMLNFAALIDKIV
ncbi:hypothetical protein CDSM653_02310 [Caldanaerobacter subterraneus subsp. pacificus DSM 12653]|uniref:Uncharacterized protein n=1 Tax=Caldanaerobacter subterraneus subsp. pacificus DSM 12653 TaxID=391606 RepID=A0A0F5PJX7_9THEO|nr:hypothetical protein CDSM653_02310 [Caldanaerobacter subterraneus subsp. pacificus DSM 12653]